MVTSTKTSTINEPFSSLPIIFSRLSMTSSFPPSSTLVGPTSLTLPIGAMREVRERRKKGRHSGGDGSEQTWRSATNDTMKTGIGGITSFFFTHFPENYKAREMWEIFRRYGEVQEVYIPTKMDRNGRRFGFVRFTDVEDEYLLGVKLDSIFIVMRRYG
ncbi:hypothetical protein VNO78_26474 [Psophocarpus tetragonolobus]|uniref:RRM domain-containing protein n=1 Tax=Psophocarpus tetragonolobus TaxID=3891 RepID=A0AAN9S213_PSOTE